MKVAAPQSAERKVAIVITPCSAKKSAPPEGALRAEKLRQGSQASVADQWLKSLATTNITPQTAAQDLYRGPAFSFATKAAEQADARFLVISAGLGLVSGNRQIPSYDLAASGDAANVRYRVRGAFSASDWWMSVSEGPYSLSLSRAITSSNDGLVLIALSRPYANLVSEALGRLHRTTIERLRIFGVVQDILPAKLQRQVMPYDTRLDNVFGGTAGTFAQRAMCHFASLLDGPRAFPTSTEQQRAYVQKFLERQQPIERTHRAPISDSKLLIKIEGFHRRGLSRSAALRVLRDEQGIACEYNRFRRHFEATQT